ncbi:hypothetical protein TCSYLVIO_004439 [Trypanosoma cruzi]|uniref:START domain-containing protein 10 n=2 Tax=Trypanosoma cruzi TaxID=5693 RepID=V5BC62_TRYCR|nr:hypothetical protein TCSYLVIO_004439 [Trypanosoma cruzi]ESS70875.1 hypothetical protein TCDM_00306 [Trypanosoma cruzi Dm28c]PBJ72709.1 hypothetical protein BCY84_15275 [Trypanosoma cruzi cruzi]PWU95166.1 hypothetical protein C4B63_23g228 [Trypanosoma cruzi]RNF24359.1 hypothetical protein TcG_00845 [Trypanosoma cruzi]
MSNDELFVESSGQKYKLQTLSDFRAFKQFALSEDNWSSHYSDAVTTVESRPPEDTSVGLNIVRVRREMRGVPGLDLYDNLHDAKYREVWDENMIEGYNIVKLNAHNDIGYYSAKFPWPLKNRDFCNIRSWMEFSNGEFIIFNHSVKHADCPEKKGFIRARSILTGYLIQSLGEDGCVLTYITQSDPRGSIPHSVINFTATRLVPKVMTKLETSTKKYPAYVSQNHTVSREALPWRTPKMDWNSSYHFPGDEMAFRNVFVPHINGDTSDGEPHVTPDAATNAPRETSPSAPFVASAVQTTESFSLAPVAPNFSDDTEAVQQYRALMQEAINTVDRTFLQDGKPPEMSQYLTRLSYIIDGIRQTTPH